MLTPRSKSAVVNYLLVVMMVVGLTLLLRLLITWAAEEFLHPIPIVGGWLKSLEIVELTGIVLFALLGFSLGGATRYLSAKTPLAVKAIALVIALPLVFFSSYWLRHQLWLNQLATESGLPREEVVNLADQALGRESGRSGFWGYYRITIQMPILPATMAELQRMTEDQKWFRSELTRFSGIEPGVFSMIFDGAGWGIRIFYMGLAALTTVIYFLKGVGWADAERLRTLTKPVAKTLPKS
ncbi:MAG: alpha/beta hydrolase [Leptolyngbyaceae cyanobacterium SM2_5_2]|nr:alpha/beta hydrolase [Leptolyngbyaceae cyanobacterium SM2_5_2]